LSPTRRLLITLTAAPRPTSSILHVPRSLDDVYGPGIAVCARPALEPGVPATRHRGTRDVFSARPVAVAGDTPLVCSAGGTDPELLAHLRDSGLPTGTDLRQFHDEAGFAARLAEALADGLRIAAEYPLPATLCPADRAVKSGALVGLLNNKAGIDTLVDPAFRARRTRVPRTALAAATPTATSWVLKGATDHAHGGGLDVHLHRAGDPVALPAFTELLDEFVVEEYLTITHNWGVQLHVPADGTARLLAVTEQRIDAVGVYSGGRFGAVDQPPAALLAECLAVASRAADLGYRGMCSLDCARTDDGRLVLLDLNFRLTGGSVPVLAMATEGEGAIAESVTLTSPAPIADLLAELRPHRATGDLLVVGGHDSGRTDNPVRLSTLQVLVLGDDPDVVAARRHALATRRGPQWR
jgi:hypothetical protein